MNRHFRRQMRKVGYGANRILSQLDSRSIEYAYCMIDARNYDIFVKTSQSDIVLYIQIINDEKEKSCYMKFTEDNWIDFIQNKFSKIIHDPSFRSFTFRKGENVLDI